MDKQVRVSFVGDVKLAVPDSRYLFERSAAALRKADITVGLLECNLSNAMGGRQGFICDAKGIEALKDAGFDVFTFASNHGADFGPGAVMETIDLLKQNGIQVVGAGENLAKAREHVVVEKNGIKIAFVDRCMASKAGNEATENRGGVAAFSIKTFYEPMEDLRGQPGTPARTWTIADHEDLAELKQAIGRAKAAADVVVACFHWGVHNCHDLAMYQPEVAYAAIESGADMVVGTHPHVLQAMDVYRGKPIFYSLGNFAFTMRGKGQPSRRRETVGIPQPGREGGSGPWYSMVDFPYEPGFSERTGQKLARRQTIIVECDISKDGVQKVGLRPVLADQDSAAAVLQDPNQEEYRKIATLIRRICKISGVEFSAEGDRLIMDMTKEVDVRALIKYRLQSYPSLSWIE